MQNTNVVVLVGRLTKDPTVKYTPSGTCVIDFSIAVNERIKKGDAWEDEANFFDCAHFGKNAEALSKLLAKGKLIAVNGKLKQDRWDSDGQNRSKVKIICHSIELLSPREGNAPQSQGTPEQQGFGGSSEQFEDDSIPF